jgi:hypothetical protein
MIRFASDFARRIIGQAGAIFYLIASLYVQFNIHPICWIYLPLAYNSLVV